MTHTRTRLIRQVLTSVLCVAVLYCILITSVFAEGNPLASPSSVKLTDADGNPITSGQEITIGDSFNVIYNYNTIEDIDSSVEYTLPKSNYLQIVIEETETFPVEIPINSSTEPDKPLGILRVAQDGTMTFQFNERFNGNAIEGFFLTFSVKLDENTVQDGDEIILHFPVTEGTADFNIKVVDPEKEPPEISKKVTAPTETSSSGDVELLWTVIVKNPEDPNNSISIHDKWTENQEYVDGSFCVDGIPVTEGLSINDDGSGFNYDLTNITPNSEYTITYKTRIKSSAFLNNGTPITSGSIKCENGAQAFPIDNDEVPLTEEAKAVYSHPITWMYKTSENVINYETGEMEWTITIYNNGLNMKNVILYDRLSPGVSIKEGTTPTIQIGNGADQPLPGFQRTSDTDISYGSDSSKMYNLEYDLSSIVGDIGNVAFIKYTTVIKDWDAYNEGSEQSQNKFDDNRAFISYQLLLTEGGAGMSPVFTSPVVEKSGGYDAGYIGKAGVIEPAYHTIKWTVTVNAINKTLTDVTVTDKLTEAAPVSAVPGKKQYCDHVYDDSIERNRPLYSTDDGVTFTPFTYDNSEPYERFSYRFEPNDAGVYEIVFYLGDINEKEKVIITFRSTVTDEIIYANNITNNNCAYQNKAKLSTSSNTFPYVDAEVFYKSDVFHKFDARSWHNKSEHAYDFEDNQLPWLMRVNINQMEMKDIVISDTLSEGTSLVEGSIILGTGTDYWYDLKDQPNKVIIPKGTYGSQKPYYTYSETSRELKIYLEDITGDDVGTANATKQIVFYVKVNVDDPIFNDPTKTGYIPIKNGVWSIQNTGMLENDYLNGDNAVKDGATFIVYVQHLSKSGTPYNNGGYYSIDYSLAINRIQQALPETAVIQDTLPEGLRLDPSTLHLYEATVISPDDFYIIDNGTNGTLVKGNEISAELYHLETTVSDENQTVMRVTLPENSDTKMYILEYSCDVTDISKAPFINNAYIEGVSLSKTDHTTTSIILNSASGGGMMMSAVKTMAYVTKKDSSTGLPVEGAVFGIYQGDNLLQGGTTDENGQIVFENLTKDVEYTIKEIEPAPDYLPSINISQDFKATDKDNPVKLTFTNAPIIGSLQFIKTDDEGAALPGAQFGIWDDWAAMGDTAPLQEATSQVINGSVTFTGLKPNKTYYIAEITAPDSYQKSNEVIVAIMDAEGKLEKLYLNSDDAKADITEFQNSPMPLATLVVSKTVTGNMGSRTKLFTFTLTVTADDVLQEGSTLKGKITKADKTETEVTITVGNPYKFELAHGEFLTVNGIAPGTKYTVTEEDYSSERYTTTYITTQDDVSTPRKPARTAEGLITSGTNTQAFTNDANVAIPTGIFLDIWPYAFILLLATFGGAMLLRKKVMKERHNK